MKSITVAVKCCSCGKQLRGTQRLSGLGFHVNRHKRPDGRSCDGHLRNEHQAVSRG